MNQPAPNPGGTKPKLKNKRVAVLCSILALLIFGTLAVGLPYVLPDGTEKFTGREAQVAKWAIGDGGYEANTDPIPDLTVVFRARIASVTKSEPTYKCGRDKQGVLYTIKIDRVTFFGIGLPGTVQSYCLMN